MNPAALVLSFHNWRDKRKAGFHALGEALLENGYGVLFWSCGRTAVDCLRGLEERTAFARNLALFRTALRPPQAGELINFTRPVFALPGGRRSALIRRFNRRAYAAAGLGFARAAKAAALAPGVVILESCDAVLFAPLLKQLFPAALLVYRPSDPIVCWAGSNPDLVRAELRVLEMADWVALVNEQGRAQYAKHTSALESKATIIANGFDLAPFERVWPMPEQFADWERVFFYAGAMEPHWDAILAAAAAAPEALFYIVCPRRPGFKTRWRLKQQPNVRYVPGMYPEEIPPLLCRATAVLVPYPDRLRGMPLGLHSKLLQAMAARKPIIAYNTEITLAHPGIRPCRDITEFAAACREAAPRAAVDYPVDLAAHDWARFKRQFMRQLNAVARHPNPTQAAA